MKVDINKRWFEFYMETPKSEGEWFISVLMFRKKWEFGFTRDTDPKADRYLRSNYYFYWSKLSGPWMGHIFEFPRGKRWHNVKESV